MYKEIRGEFRVYRSRGCGRCGNVRFGMAGYQAFEVHQVNIKKIYLSVRLLGPWNRHVAIVAHNDIPLNRILISLLADNLRPQHYQTTLKDQIILTRFNPADNPATNKITHLRDSSSFSCMLCYVQEVKSIKTEGFRLEGLGACWN